MTTFAHMSPNCRPKWKNPPPVERSYVVRSHPNKTRGKPRALRIGDPAIEYMRRAARLRVKYSIAALSRKFRIRPNTATMYIHDKHKPDSRAFGKQRYLKQWQISQLKRAARLRPQWTNAALGRPHGLSKHAVTWYLQGRHMRVQR
jgi:hypothetical protein